MRAKVLAVAIIASFGAQAHAEQRTITVRGDRDCSSWLAHRADERAGRELAWTSRNGDDSWVLGYLSGVNVMLTADVNLLNDVDADTVAAWVDKHCLLHPKERISDAADALVVKILEIKTKNGTSAAKP